MPGKEVTLHDARLAVPSETVMLMREVSYNFDNERVVVSGHAEMGRL